MARGDNETMVIGATRFAIGLSTTPYLVTAPTGAIDGGLRWISGGTLEILPNVIPGASVAGQTVAGIGYNLGTAEQFTFDGPAAFWLMSAGGTCVVGMHWHFSYGATV